MYYHIRIDYFDAKLKANQTVYEYDKVEDSLLKSDIIIPYIEEKPFMFAGVRLNTKNNEVRQLRVFRSEYDIKKCTKIANENIPSNVIMVYGKEDVLPYEGIVEECTGIINDVQKEIENVQIVKETMAKEYDISNVFIVHGHDNEARLSVEGFLTKVGLKPIVLFKEPDEGNTIIEKFEKHSNVGFAIVLYTYCDDGKDKNNTVMNQRARQNVVFEHGYLIAKLGRNRVCALRKGNIEIPGDYQGVIFKSMGNDGGWQLELAKELKAAGYEIDLNKLL